MKVAIKGCSVFLITFAACCSAWAYPQVNRADTTVSWVLFACDSSESSDTAGGYCAGFIEGVADTVNPWCVPAETTKIELRELIISDLRNYDEFLAPAAPSIKAIIAARWPCD